MIDKNSNHKDKIKEIEKMKEAIESLNDEEMEEINDLAYESLRIK